MVIPSCSSRSGYPDCAPFAFAAAVYHGTIDGMVIVEAPSADGIRRECLAMHLRALVRESDDMSDERLGDPAFGDWMAHAERNRGDGRRTARKDL